MTVQELINELEKIEDRTQIVGIYDQEWDYFDKVSSIEHIKNAQDIGGSAVEQELSDPLGVRVVLS